MRGSWRLWDTLTFPDRSRWCPKSVSKSWSRIVCPSGLSISRLCMVRRPSPFGNHWKGLLVDEEFGFQAVGHKDPARPSTSPLDEIALFAAGNFNEASPSVWSDSFGDTGHWSFLFAHGVIFSLLLRDAPCHQVSECVATNKTRRCARINQ